MTYTVAPCLTRGPAAFPETALDGLPISFSYTTSFGLSESHALFAEIE
jgi:hypothetical protein